MERHLWQGSLTDNIFTEILLTDQFIIVGSSATFHHIALHSKLKGESQEAAHSKVGELRD